MSNRFPSRETVARLREQYPAGTRIELLAMDDPYSTLRPGDLGSVSFVDDTGSVFVDWDNGSRLGLVYGVDRYKKSTEPIYKTGAEFWRDTAMRHGQKEADGICGRYLATQLKMKQPEDERLFCRELFAAMYEDVAGLADSAKLVYPYSLQKADERLEASYYHKSAGYNGECARAIDAAINASCYERDHYNLELAAMAVIQQYGFNRVNAVLAHNLQRHDSDGRYSRDNKEWAQGFSLPDEALRYSYMNAHPILLEDFTKYARRLYSDVDAKRHLLPGIPEGGSQVQGYWINRSVWFDDNRGFAIGHNPAAPSPYVCWQFTTENGKREYYWGAYCNTEKEAADNLIARVTVHMDGGGVRDVYNHLAAAEMAKEQNYNQIDGSINNEKSRLDLTDGQTHEEISELAPASFPREKPSVLEQIREARQNPQPHAPNKARDKGAPELER